MFSTIDFLAFVGKRGRGKGKRNKKKPFPFNMNPFPARVQKLLLQEV
ncbi:hypothetical protein COO91_10716 (plasmid) [Nostoc flagelliforme CCNUN1]|uniref:Uncharacterized protein n=1 Tax=Nostoc flagelliforme CCNUN1 TaxID=2038116 RepID=A0A2K8TA05_9NOSO|nr:hypothetical protein COO91_10526 [Nostoc flagelliforme CCNUN1]AUB44489.1 hypothetical protein COO91_10716 [Nostoc flagelliforme CCNUN1]